MVRCSGYNGSTAATLSACKMGAWIHALQASASPEVRNLDVPHGPAGGKAVPFTLYVPPTINTSLPVIFMFNGFSVEGDQYS